MKEIGTFCATDCLWQNQVKYSLWGWPFTRCDKYNKDLTTKQVKQVKNITYCGFLAINTCDEETQELEILEVKDGED